MTFTPATKRCPICNGLGQVNSSATLLQAECQSCGWFYTDRTTLAEWSSEAEAEVPQVR